MEILTLATPLYFSSLTLSHSIISVRSIFSDCRLWWCTAGEANQSYLIVKKFQTSSHQPISLSSNSIQELHSSHIIQTLQKSCSGLKIQVQRTNYWLWTPKLSDPHAMQSFSHSSNSSLLFAILQSFQRVLVFHWLKHWYIDAMWIGDCSLLLHLFLCVFSFEEILLGFMLLSALSANS